MDRVWSVFWKLYGIAFGAATLLSIILGIVQRSGQLVFVMVQNILGISMGLCGIIGLVLVPVEMYFTDRAARTENKKPAGASGDNNDLG
ncbi:MAG: hypothetical protein LBO67_09340 [Spirochaetaceae bacterium]|jgi:hypothetical protein|nr:hypothetical protein [Spirochaetaceae bacterium]